jgi:uncharacterized membrane protein
MVQLKKHLYKLPFDEAKEAVDYYEQYFDDPGKENELSVLSELGSPSVVASQIIASFAAKDTGNSRQRGLSTAWMTIIAIFATPVALPVALVVAVLAFVLVIVMLAIVISIGGAGVGFVAGGIMSVVTSGSIVSQSFSTALFFLGLGLTASGIGLATIIGTVKISKIGFAWLAKNVGEFIIRRNKK